MPRPRAVWKRKANFITDVTRGREEISNGVADPGSFKKKKKGICHLSQCGKAVGPLPRSSLSVTPTSMRVSHMAATEQPALTSPTSPATAVGEGKRTSRGKTCVNRLFIVTAEVGSEVGCVICFCQPHSSLPKSTLRGFLIHCTIRLLDLLANSCAIKRLNQA